MRKLTAAPFVTAIFFLFAFAAPLHAQKTAPKAKPKLLSPPAHAECRLPGGKIIHVDYSSPRMRGRKIFGGLVPYGKVWRVGANKATTFDTTANVSIGGKTIPAGNYTMFALPEPGKWTLIISKKTGEWGIPYPGEQYDFARMPMEVSNLSKPLEDFTISFVHTPGGCSMRFDWATTRASALIRKQK